MCTQALPEGVYRESLVFTPEETDALGHVRADAIAHRFQEIAGMHHSALGVGQEVAVTKGSFWALARTEMKMTRMPRVGEPLFLDTWVGRHAHGLFWRHYRIMDREEKPVLYAVSIWVIMDIQTRALTKNHTWADGCARVTVEGELPATFRSIPFPEELGEHRERRVTDAETDSNGHLNNCLYLRWGQNLLPGEFARTHELRSVWIEYRKEMPRGLDSDIAYSLDGTTLYARGTAEDKERFLLRMEHAEI